MKPICILYATREGQTQRIAEHVAAELRVRGFTVAVTNVQTVPRLTLLVNPPRDPLSEDLFSVICYKNNLCSIK